MSLVKRILLYLDDDEFGILQDLKGKDTWHTFLIEPHLEALSEVVTDQEEEEEGEEEEDEEEEEEEEEDEEED